MLLRNRSSMLSVRLRVSAHFLLVGRVKTATSGVVAFPSPQSPWSRFVLFSLFFSKSAATFSCIIPLVMRDCLDPVRKTPKAAFHGFPKFLIRVLIIDSYPYCSCVAPLS